MFTFWVAMGFSVVLAARPEDTRKLVIGIVASCAVIAVCAFDYPDVARPWATSWALQREVLDTIKGQSFPKKLEPGDAVLSDFPEVGGAVPVFDAPWSIPPAAMIAWSDVIPDIARKRSSPVTIVPLNRSLKMAWEPGKLTLGSDWVIPAKRLWLWRWKSGDAVLVKSPGALPQEPLDGLFDTLRSQ